MGVNGPTPKQRALGAALKEERLQRYSGSLRSFATNELAIDPSLLSRWESGVRSPKPSDVARILTVLDVEPDRYEEIVALAESGTEASSWPAISLLEQKQHLAAILRFEEEASAITANAPLVIPAGLQTTAYVRAIMKSGSVPDDDIDTRTAVRLGRRERLSEVRLTALIGEAALRMEIGGVHVLRDQLRHLIQRADQVDMRVIPFSAGWNPSLGGPWTVIEFADDLPVVHVENRRGGLFLHEPDDVAVYQESVTLAMEAAMSPQDSVGLIAEVIEELAERDTNDDTGEVEKVQLQ